MRRVPLARVLFTGAAALAASTCVDPPLAPLTPVASVVVTPRQDTLPPGDTVRFTATPQDEQGNLLTGRAVEWSSSNTTVAPVSEDGVVSGQAEGVAIIKATVEDVDGSAVITVRSVIASVTVTPVADTIPVGQAMQLSAMPRDSAGRPVSNRTIAWSSAAPGVATVSSSGLVTGRGDGVARIIATVQGASDTADITVWAPVASVLVTPVADTLMIGATRQLVATPMDSLGRTLSPRPIAWSSLNSTVAGVSASGLVVALAQGMASVEARYGGAVGGAAVAVRNSATVAAVAVSPESSVLPVGGSVQLTATPRDSSGDALVGRRVTWSSSAPALAAVSALGIVTGLSEGVAVITATVDGTPGTASLTVQVEGTSLTITPDVDTVAVSATRQLVATARDSMGNTLPGRVITWSSSAPAIATVSDSGLVTGVAEGVATIQASSGALSDSATVTVKSLVPVALVQVLPAAESLFVGETRQFTATPRDAAGSALIGRRVGWSSGDPSIVGVSASGLVTILASGTATVTAEVEGLLGTAAVTAVRADLTGEWVISLTQYYCDYYNCYQINEAGSMVLTQNASAFAGTLGRDGTSGFVIEDMSGSLVGRSISFMAGPTQYWGTVSANGTMSGEFCWYSYCYYGYGSWQAARAGPVVSLAVAPTARTMVVGGSVQLRATPKDAAGNALLGHPLTWSSSAPSVATVSSRGLVSAVAAGAATVTGATEALSATSSIVVTTVSFASVTTGQYHSCGLSPQGAAYCWGDNASGKLGDSSSIYSSAVPVPVAGGLTYTSVSAGASHTCALTAAGAAYCWGYNGLGQLGNGTYTESGVPVPVSGGLSFASISAGNLHTCALTAGGAAHCWGNNTQGQLGSGFSFASSTSPLPVAGGFLYTVLSAGADHSCAITSAGAAYCWGYSGAGQLGDGSNIARAVPVPVAGGFTFATLSGGLSHTCGVTTAGVARCWGNNGSGQLGDGSTTTRLAPVTSVTGGLTFASVDAGNEHSCGRTTAGLAYCWGGNNGGSLGNGSAGGSTVPTPVFSGLTYTSVSAGGSHSCAIATGNVGYCWGYNGQGQVGNGSSGDSYVPVRVAGQP